MLQEVLFNSEGSGCQSEAALMVSDSDILAADCSWSNIRMGPQIQTSGTCELMVTDSTFDGIGSSNAAPYNTGINAGAETRLTISGTLFTNLCHGVICHDHGGPRCATTYERMECVGCGAKLTPLAALYPPLCRSEV